MPLFNWSTTASFSWHAVASSKCGALWATTSSAPSTARWGRRSFQGGKDARQLENFLLPILGCLVTIERLLRRADREAEGARLLSEYAPKGHLGFESPALRQYEFEEGSHLGPFFIIKNGGWGFEPSKRRHPFGRLLSVDLLFLRPTSQEPWLRSRFLP